MTAILGNNVLVVGAGGHARVCVEALRDAPSYRIVGGLSADGLAAPGLDLAMLGRDVDLAERATAAGATHAFIAVGHNATRAAIADRCLAHGLVLVDAVSRFAMLSSSTRLAGGVAVLPGAVVNAATDLGPGVIVNTNASVDHDCQIGPFVHVAPGAVIGGGVQVGSRTLVGIGAVVLPGVRIGADVVIGAGAVVVRDLPDGCVVVGVPARPR